MSILERLGFRNKAESPHREPGTTRVLDRRVIDELLAESCRCILEKDLAGLNRLIAMELKFEVPHPDPNPPRRIALDRTIYMSYIAAAFRSQSLESYRLTIAKVLHESDREWMVECHSQAQARDKGSFDPVREVATIGIVNGHPVVTALYLDKWP
jgi:hypothetical protein